MSRDLGRAALLGIEVIGEPGQRRFYLFVQAAQDSALLWMEKEQLNRLSLALDRALAQVSEGQFLRTEARAGGLPPPATMPRNFPRRPEYDFRVAQMNLAYDQRDQTFAFSLAPMDIVSGPGQEPQALVHEEETLAFSFTQEQARALSTAIVAAINSGRPVCPLCHAVLDGGPHACEKQNGHHEILQITREDEEE